MRGPAPAAGGFKNYSGPQAEQYLAFRPRYPVELLDYLGAAAGGTALAWDCGTGNGQAAVGLAERFTRVVATDPSADMIAHAIPHARVTYRVARYQSGLPDNSANLVTVAQALHWFDLDEFLPEARRVLLEKGVLAAWCYSLCRIDAGLDEVIDQYYTGTLGSFWPPERWHTDDRYRSFALPLDELGPPPFEMSESWTMNAFIRYVRTWSGTNLCIAARGEGPVLAFENSLCERWGNPLEPRQVRWPIHCRIGRFREAG
ncbi:MAG TPA: class I SAM-dependent methyltransferase [Gemmatimonadaceae bacterium]|nr:class I SAM-dependent methyltransferase [Gemmatimonadaceae bacterium]